MLKKLWQYSGVILSILSLIYIWSFTQDRYQSNSQFSIVVKDDSNAKASMGILAMMGSGNSGSHESQLAIGFIHSSDMLLSLEEQYSLREHYTSPEKDFYYRLDPNAKVDDRLEFYRSRIKVKYDPTTGLISLGVDTFNPDLSLQVSKTILKKTEDFINKLNQDIANKRLVFAKSELKRAQKNIAKSENELLKFQNKHKIIHPEAIIQAQLEAIQSLRITKIQTVISLATLKASSPKSPMIAQMEIKIKNLQQEIQLQEEALSGADQHKLNQLLSEYKNLQLNLEFAIKLRAGSELILEKTRSEAAAHSIFFSIIQNPHLPEEKIRPRRLYLSFTVTALIFLIQFILQSLIKSVYDRV